MADYNELAVALNAFQAEVISVGKNADNPFFKSKYADLGSIMKQAQPVLTKHGLAVVQLPDNIDGKPALTTTILHKSGQSISATVPLVLSKEDPQGFGSAMTYYRRYGYASALQIVIDEDDDGNRASQHKPIPKSKSMATEGQRKFVKDLLAQHGVSDEDAPGYLVEEIGVEVPLTFEGAQFVIEELKSNKVHA